MKLPVIVGMGGINSAGRSSGFHAYKRMVHDALSPNIMQATWQDLGNRMQMSDKPLTNELIEYIKQNTLIRRIDNKPIDAFYGHQKAVLLTGASLVMKRSKVPDELLSYCDLAFIDSHDVRLTLRENIEVFLPATHPSSVTSGGCLPKGFHPEQLYHSVHHPRGLTMTVYGISDALSSLGLEWDDVIKHIRPDEIAVYAGSALSQIDHHSMAGMIMEPLLGNRVNSKMMAMSLAEMPADFINGYVVNSVGTTGHNMGACATFLYNLRQAIHDIQQEKAKIVIVGCSEAPIEQAIIEGFRVMGALATDESIQSYDKTSFVDNRRACRPFSTNFGFTLAESSQFFILMSDELAVSLGANILGSVADVFINADGNKKSIASPGVGNYITMAKAAALAKAILGKQSLQNHTYVQAHGTGTPQNRTTESHILNEIAKTFSISKWPVSAIKSYIGHSISAAAGDQLNASLGAWQYGFLPGIKTIDHIAHDVHQSHLNVLMDHQYIGEKGDNMKAVFINSKGFGGNNATALVLSPAHTRELLTQRHGKQAMLQYHHKNANVLEMSTEHDIQACLGKETIFYSFGEQVMNETSITIHEDNIQLSAFEQPIQLPTDNPY